MLNIPLLDVHTWAWRSHDDAIHVRAVIITNQWWKWLVMMVLYIYYQTFEDGVQCQHRIGTAKVCLKSLQQPWRKDTNASPLRHWASYLWPIVSFDQKADAKEQREDVEGGDYFGKVLVNLDRQLGLEVDKEEVAEKWNEVELDSVGWVSADKIQRFSSNACGTHLGTSPAGVIGPRKTFEGTIRER